MKSIEVAVSVQKTLFQEHCDIEMCKQFQTAYAFFLLSAGVQLHLERQMHSFGTACVHQTAFDNASLREL